MRTSTPYSSSASVTCAHANSSSRGSSRRSPSISVTCAPSVWNACDISTPTTPPPMITSRSGISFAVVASRLVHASSIASSPSIGGIEGSEPVDEDHRARRLELLVAHPHPPLAGQLADAAHERDVAILQPRQLRRVVEVVDDLVAASEHGLHVELRP